MENQIAYEFASEQTATRFLNHLKSGSVCGVKARRDKDSRTILASYRLINDTGFDPTCQELDSLAASMDGREVSSW